MVDEDFDGFLARLRAAASAEQRQDLLAHAVDAIGTWSSATCVVWLGRLAADPLVGLDDVDGVSARPLAGWDEFAASAVLLEALFARAAELDVADAIGCCRDLFVELTCCPVTFEIPRRYLIPAYVQWIDDDFLPGCGEYRAQFVRKATAQEVVDAAKRAMAAGNQVCDELAPHLAADALRRVDRLEPELLTVWLERIENETGLMEDPDFAALCVAQRTGRAGFALGAELPPALRDYLAAGQLRRVLVADAKVAVDAVDAAVVRAPTQGFAKLLDRDMSLLVAQLPNGLEGLCCDTAKGLLRDYRRLRALEASRPLNLCLLLTKAVEAQLQHALGHGHDSNLRRRLERQGLAALAEFTRRPSDRLPGLVVRPQLDDKAWEALNRAGRIRNAVHHEPCRISDADVDALHRAVFDTDARAIQLLKKLAALRCVRSG